ncbi:MAG: PAS domain S-box protein [Desulfobacterales bacterium]
MKQVLVVDNHPVIRKFMSSILMEKGHSVFTAEDGISALGILSEYIPDVIFIDLIMPNISGNKVCQIIRRRQHLDHCLLVVLSAIAAEEEDMLLNDLGADLILAKGPFNRLSGHVADIMALVEAGQEDRLKGSIMGRENLSPRQITRELLNSKRHYETTLHHMSEGLLEVLDDGQIVYANPAAVSIIGTAEEDLLSTDFIRLFREKDQPLIAQRFFEAAQAGQKNLRNQTLELNDKLVSVTIIPVREQSRHYTMVVMLRDITRQKHAERELQERQEKYKQERNFLDNIFENSPNAIAIVDHHGRFTRWNHQAARLFGYDFAELKGKKAFHLYADAREMEKMLGLLRKQGSVQDYEIGFTRKDGTSVPCAVSINLLRNDAGEKIGSLSVIRDLSEWRRVEQKLKYLSFHDSLTGAYNRAFFEEEMQRLATERHLPLGLIICDIDFLKRVNDTMGHQQGDTLIVTAADILKNAFRTGDIIARIGGDEFAVLIPRSSPEIITNCIHRLREMIADFRARRPELNLSISIGYAISTGLPVDTRALFKKADDHMYLEKSKLSC